jgi:hypothetical protein
LVKLIKISLLLFTAFLLYSCSDSNIVQPGNETLLYEKPGLVDSAVVYGCYSYTLIYFVPDTLQLRDYSKIRVMFDGNANSDGTNITVYMNSPTEEYYELYKVDNAAGINKIHSVESPVPFTTSTLKVRLYINPPVCGQGEFKYNRVRDLKIYGIK